jgi:hypothetical protein
VWPGWPSTGRPEAERPPVARSCTSDDASHPPVVGLSQGDGAGPMISETSALRPHFPQLRSKVLGWRLGSWRPVCTAGPAVEAVIARGNGLGCPLFARTPPWASLIGLVAVCSKIADLSADAVLSQGCERFVLHPAGSHASSVTAHQSAQESSPCLSGIHVCTFSLQRQEHQTREESLGQGSLPPCCGLQARSLCRCRRAGAAFPSAPLYP